MRVVNLYVVIKISGVIGQNSKYWIDTIEWTSEVSMSLVRNV